MHPHHAPPIPASLPDPGAPPAPALEVADVFAAVGLDAFRLQYPLNPRQNKAFSDILRCRTPALGGHLQACAACGHQTPVYNSCCNRSCPRCQGLAQHRWIEARKLRVLPCRYFHVVFTLPAQLRPLALSDPDALYSLLFQAASQTLLTLGRDHKRLGAHLGFTAVLHTWSRDLSLHPHLHCIVTAGGLALDRARWIPSAKAFLFPVKVLAKGFRDRLLCSLRQRFKAGALSLPRALQSPGAFSSLLKSLFNKLFRVYAKAPFPGADQLYAYLGRYTHRIGISRARLLAFDGRSITFRTRGDRSVTLTALEFVRRFLMHVLPRGFVKIRHYGLFASPNVGWCPIIA